MLHSGFLRYAAYGVAVWVAVLTASGHAGSFSVPPVTDKAGEREGNAPFMPLSESDADAQLRFWPAFFPEDVSSEGRFALEFRVADLGPIGSVESVRLALFPNAASFQGSAALDVVAYFGDGAITSGDFEFGTTIGGPVMVTDMLPMVTDVTSFVVTAASAGRSHVGFVIRLHSLANGEPPFVPFVPFATKEFPNPRFHPTLLVQDTSVPLAGDANGDGRVDRADVAALVSIFAATVTGPALAADFDGDGAVSVADLMSIQRNFEISSLAAATAGTPNHVPEPRAIVLLAVGLALLALRRVVGRFGSAAIGCRWNRAASDARRSTRRNARCNARLA